jgi:hypothetical protein
MAVTPFSAEYLNQLRLVVRILPAIPRNGAFALKGSTAINVFEKGFSTWSVAGKQRAPEAKSSEALIILG